MFWMAAARSEPSASADGSLNLASPLPAAAAAPGVGVTGTLAVAPPPAVGAAGGAGVETEGAAGVDGGFAVDEDAEAEVDGAALGCGSLAPIDTAIEVADLLDHAHDESLLLNLVGLNGIGILQDLARVDKFLLACLPSLLRRNLPFYLANLDSP